MEVGLSRSAGRQARNYIEQGREGCLTGSQPLRNGSPGSRKYRQEARQRAKGSKGGLYLQTSPRPSNRVREGELVGYS